MTIALSILLTMVYVISWVFYTKYQIQERRLPDSEEEVDLAANKKWHKWKFVNQVSFFGITALAIGPINALCLSLAYWVVFDALVAVIVLNMPYYYLGSTPSIDRYFKGKLSEKTFFYLRCGAVIATIVIKLIFKL